MDSRPQDDFKQPESAVVDDGTPATHEALSNEQLGLSAAGAEAADAGEPLLDMSADFEAELASLLAPDLDAIDLDKPSAEAWTSGTPDGHPLEDAAATVALTAMEASVQTRGEAVSMSAPEAGNNDATPSAPESIDAVSITAAIAAVVFEAPAPAVAEFSDVETTDPALDARSPEKPADQPVVEAMPAAAPAAVAPVAVSVAAPADAVVPAATEAGVVAAAEPIAEAAAMTAEAMDETRAAGADAPVEAISFEAALEAQDIEGKGFEAAVRGAADRAEARFLFQMPVHTVPDCKRVAAVNLPGTEKPVTVLVLLQEDGRSIRMEDARGSDNPFAGMAVSYGGLLAHLKSLPTRSAA